MIHAAEFLIALSQKGKQKRLTSEREWQWWNSWREMLRNLISLKQRELIMTRKSFSRHRRDGVLVLSLRGWKLRLGNESFVVLSMFGVDDLEFRENEFPSPPPLILPTYDNDYADELNYFRLIKWPQTHLVINDNLSCCWTDGRVEKVLVKMFDHQPRFSRRDTSRYFQLSDDFHPLSTHLRFLSFIYLRRCCLFPTEKTRKRLLNVYFPTVEGPRCCLPWHLINWFHESSFL